MQVSHNLPCLENCLIKLVAMLREDSRLAQNQLVRSQSMDINTSAVLESSDEGPSKETQILQLPDTLSTSPIHSSSPRGIAIPTHPAAPSLLSIFRSPANNSPSGSIASSSPRRSISPLSQSTGFPITADALSKSPNTKTILYTPVVLDSSDPPALTTTTEPHVHNSEVLARSGHHESFTPIDPPDMRDDGNGDDDLTLKDEENLHYPYEKLDTSSPNKTLDGNILTNKSEAIDSQHVAPTKDPPVQQVTNTSIPKSASLPSLLLPRSEEIVTTSTPRENRKISRETTISPNVPSPRKCSVAISPTGRQAFLQTIYFRNPPRTSSTSTPSDTVSMAQLSGANEATKESVSTNEDPNKDNTDRTNTNNNNANEDNTNNNDRKNIDNDSNSSNKTNNNNKTTRVITPPILSIPRTYQEFLNLLSNTKIPPTPTTPPSTTATTDSEATASTAATPTDIPYKLNISLR